MEYIYNELEVLWEPTWIATCHVAANQSLEREVPPAHAKVHRESAKHAVIIWCVEPVSRPEPEGP